MAHLDVATVRCRALKVVVDLLMWHGLQAFISNSEDDDGNDDDADEAADDDRFSSVSMANNRQVGAIFAIVIFSCFQAIPVASVLANQAVIVSS